MENVKITEFGEVSVPVMSKENWDKKLSAVKESGIRIADKWRAQGHAFIVEILAPREVCGGQPIPLAAAKIELNWQIGVKLKMVESARDMITGAHMLDSLNPIFPKILASIIEGQGLYEYGIGEFFLLYGKFEQKYRLSRGKDTRAKMANLINGNTCYMKAYEDRGKTRLEPLPYAVRNILSHAGNNPNMLDAEGNDLRASIELLRTWVR